MRVIVISICHISLNPSSLTIPFTGKRERLPEKIQKGTRTKPQSFSEHQGLESGAEAGEGRHSDGSPYG